VAADDAVQEARKSIAELIRADAEEIVFTSGATEANNLAILGLLGHRKTARTRVVVSAIEHKCVLQSSRQLSFSNMKSLPARASIGHVDIDALESLIDENTALVSIMTSTTRWLHPTARKDWDLCRKAGTVFHSDAAQQQLQ